VLELFLELERIPRGNPQFNDKSRRLARLLNLTAEWWSMCHVNDRSEKPCWPPGYIACQDWQTCRRMRLALLECNAERDFSRAAPVVLT
jgi:hypothetical protein